MNRPGPLLITGANGGIGLATTLKAARNGWAVYATVRSAENVATMMQAVAGLPVTVDTLDVTDEQRCQEIVDAVKPYALINNAGIGTGGAIEETATQVGRDQLEVMAIAPMRLSQLALPYMRQYGGGRIINVSSLGGRTSAPLTGWYIASKHALESLSDALRMEVKRDNVAVVLIEPGGVNTGILQKSLATTSVEANSRYAVGYARAARLTSLTQRFQHDSSHVANVIVKALENSNPRARYVVGADAHLLLLAGRLFPLRVRDRFKRKLLSI